MSVLDAFSTGTRLLRPVSSHVNPVGKVGDSIPVYGLLYSRFQGESRFLLCSCSGIVLIVRGRVRPMAPVCHHHRWPVVFGARREWQRMQSGLHVTSKTRTWYNKRAFRTDKSNASVYTSSIYSICWTSEAETAKDSVPIQIHIYIYIYIYISRNDLSLYLSSYLTIYLSNYLPIYLLCVFGFLFSFYCRKPVSRCIPYFAFLDHTVIAHHPLRLLRLQTTISWRLAS